MSHSPEESPNISIHYRYGTPGQHGVNGDSTVPAVAYRNIDDDQLAEAELTLVRFTLVKPEEVQTIVSLGRVLFGKEDPDGTLNEKDNVGLAINALTIRHGELQVRTARSHLLADRIDVEGYYDLVHTN